MLTNHNEQQRLHLVQKDNNNPAASIKWKHNENELQRLQKFPVELNVLQQEEQHRDRSQQPDKKTKGLPQLNRKQPWREAWLPSKHTHTYCISTHTCTSEKVQRWKLAARPSDSKPYLHTYCIICMGAWDIIPSWKGQNPLSELAQFNPGGTCTGKVNTHTKGLYVCHALASSPSVIKSALCSASL